jgi:hypothetical protein
MSDKHTQRVVELGAIGEWLREKRQSITDELDSRGLEPDDFDRLDTVGKQIDDWLEEIQEAIVLLIQQGRLDTKDDWKDVKR